jgi:hypothetical protein
MLRPAIQKANGVGLAAHMRRSTKFASVDAFLNTMSSPAQREIVRAQAAWIGGYILTMSGRAATEAERLSGARAMLEGFGDDDESQKSAEMLRDSFVRNTLLVAQGKATPAEIIASNIATAKAFGMPKEGLKLLQDLQREVGGAPGTPEAVPADTARSSRARALQAEVMGARRGAVRP